MGSVSRLYGLCTPRRMSRVDEVFFFAFFALPSLAVLSTIVSGAGLSDTVSAMVSVVFGGIFGDEFTPARLYA
eukprot:539159-Rhodomonas_salina.3